jgi:hypothetical protein
MTTEGIYSAAALASLTGISLATWIYSAEIDCASAGMLGGTITALLTIDRRAASKSPPTPRVVLGEFLASGFMGFAVFAVTKAPAAENLTLVYAVLAGGAGSAGYHRAIAWMTNKLGGGENGGLF